MTLAQQNGITEFPYIIRDQKGRSIYYEDSSGSWFKSEYDSNGKKTYYEESTGFWRKAEYDARGTLIYYEDYDGTIVDKRPKKVNHLQVKITI